MPELRLKSKLLTSEHRAYVKRFPFFFSLTEVFLKEIIVETYYTEQIKAAWNGVGGM